VNNQLSIKKEPHKSDYFLQIDGVVNGIYRVGSCKPNTLHLFEISFVRISAGTPAILTAVHRGFTQSVCIPGHYTYFPMFSKSLFTNRVTFDAV
jgi:hypothetical protein